MNELEIETSQRDLAKLVASFSTKDPLRSRVLQVLCALPKEVQSDFWDDPRFRIVSVDTNQPTTLWMAFPSADGTGSRCVVLKPKLADCSESFALYVIAHELAHAYLRNGSWGEISDKEEAADALAAHWGFARPKQATLRSRIGSLVGKK